MDNSMLHMIFDSLEEGIAFINPDNIVTYCNIAFRTMRETAMEKIDGLPVLKLYPEERRADITQILRNLERDKDSESSNIIVQTETGRSFSDTFSVARDSYGEYMGIIIKSREVLSTAKTSEGKTITQKFVSKEVGEIKKDKTIKEITNRRRKEIQALFDLSLAPYTEETTKDVLNASLKNILEIFSIEAGDVRLVDKKKKFFAAPMANLGLSGNFIKKISYMSTDRCICGKACEDEEIRYCSDLTTERAMPCAHCIEEGFRFTAAIPLVTGGDLTGILHLASHKIKQLDDEDLKLMEIAGNYMGLILNQEKVEEKVHIAKEYLKGIISTITDPITITDPENQIIDINPALETMTGFQRKKLLRTPLLKLFPEQNIAAINEMLSSLYENGKIKELETELLTSANETVPVSLSTSLLNRPDGKPLGAIEVFKARKEEFSLQMEIKRRNKEFSLLYTLSHLLTQNAKTIEFLNKGIQEVAKLAELSPKGVFYEINPGRQELELLTAVNSGDQVESGERNVPLGECICSEVVKSGEILVTDAPGKDLDYHHHKEQWNIIVPVKYMDRTKGLLILYHNRKPAMGAGDTQLLITIGNLFGIGLELNRLIKESITFYDQSQKELHGLKSIEKLLKKMRTLYDRELLIHTFGRDMLENYDFSALSLTLIHQGAYRKWSFHTGDESPDKIQEGAAPTPRVSWVLERQKPLITEDLVRSDEKFPEDSELLRKGVTSVITLPLTGKTALLGVLSLERDNPEPPSKELICALDILTDGFAAMLDKPGPLPEAAAPLAPTAPEKGRLSEEKVLRELEEYSKIMLESGDPVLMEKTISKAAISWFAPQLIAYMTRIENIRSPVGIILSHDMMRPEITDKMREKILMEYPYKEAVISQVFKASQFDALQASTLEEGIKSFQLIIPFKYFSDTPVFFALASGTPEYFKDRSIERQAFSHLLSLYQLKLREVLIALNVTGSLAELKKLLS